jgi:hypothetical protein
VSQFALARAGCITPHEFLFQQILNHAYRDNLMRYYGEKYDVAVVQNVMDILLSCKDLPNKYYYKAAKNLLKADFEASEHVPTILNKLAEHIANHLVIAQKKGDLHYTIPHLGHDVNVQDLYQHGFDMRNPYGCNLEGAWLLISDDGSIIYGDTEKQLIEVLLTNDFLEKNPIDINHGANMAAGWAKVIKKQIDLQQTIPTETLKRYAAYEKAKIERPFFQDKAQLSNLEPEDLDNISSFKHND